MTGLDLGPLSAFSFQARAWPTGLAADISEPSYRWIRSGLAAESASLAIPLTGENIGVGEVVGS